MFTRRPDQRPKCTEILVASVTSRGIKQYLHSGLRDFRGDIRSCCRWTANAFSSSHHPLQANETHPNAFEIFGVDFIVDSTQQVYLLEVNAVCPKRPC